MSTSIETFYDKTYTLYRCSPFADFVSEDRGYSNLELRIAQVLCENLSLHLDGQQPDLERTLLKGKIILLRFRPFELEDFTYDLSGSENPPMKFELEYEIFGQTKKSSQSLILLPAIHLPEDSSSSLSYYPLVLSKLSNPVFKLVSSVFDNDFGGLMEVLDIPVFALETHITNTVNSIYRARLRDFEYVADGVEIGEFSSLKLEYRTHGNNVKTVRFSIESEQALKICKLVGTPDDFYTSFCQHISNTLKINITALQLHTVSSHIASLSSSGKLKVHNYALLEHVIEMLYLLIELATARRDTVRWVM
ncbi:hypothetical protein BDF21DRAFT_454481 [Thamnidium elegans]|nr:hypothetical protein BDF21DRAFT_454481 [Thamnidium elegans]